MFVSVGSTVTYQAQGEPSSTSLAQQIAYNVSKLLDSLLKDYDNSLRPDFGGDRNKNPFVRNLIVVCQQVHHH